MPSRFLYTSVLMIFLPHSASFSICRSLPVCFPPSGKLHWCSQSGSRKASAVIPCLVALMLCFLPSQKCLSNFSVLCQLLDSSLANNYIRDQQYGYLHDLSTVWQLLSVIEKLQCTLDVSRCIHAFFLDMSKASNHVVHALLLNR